MSLSFRALIKACLPPLLIRGARRLIQAPVFRGDYPRWTDAKARARGYDDPKILDRVIESARAVRDGRAEWERDSVLFKEPDCHWPLLSTLLHVAASKGGQLHLVDFGGSLGSTWWQHRRWLAGFSVTWRVVEQPAFVTVGQKEFTTGPLSFHLTLDDCNFTPKPDTILLSSVLPYLERPHDLLADIAGREYEHVIIDRTGFVSRGRDRLVVQRVPRQIYEASYPCWFFDRSRLLASLGDKYDVVGSWHTFDRADIDAEFCGLYLRLRR